MKMLAGTGYYVTYNRAMDIINRSSYTERKKKRLKDVIKAISKKHGIAKLLEQVEQGKVTDLGKLDTVKQYLRDIHKLGINPVTISSRMEVPEMKITYKGISYKEPMLPNLIYFIKSYGKDIIAILRDTDYPFTQEELNQMAGDID